MANRTNPRRGENKRNAPRYEQSKPDAYKHFMRLDRPRPCYADELDTDSGEL